MNNFLSPSPNPSLSSSGNSGSAVASDLWRPLVLADYLLGKYRHGVREGVLIAAGTLLVAASAQISIPFYPVPFTLQTLAILLVGATLGAKRAATSLTAYLLLGVAGIPWFAGFTGTAAAIFKPSFGFIIGFIPAAFLMGTLAQRQWDRTWRRSLGAFALGAAMPFVFGVPYMILIFHTVLGKSMSLSAALNAGLWPFIPAEVLKWLFAALLLPTLWRILDRKGLTETNNE